MATRTLTVLDPNGDTQTVSVTLGGDVTQYSEAYMLGLAEQQYGTPCVAIEMKDSE